MSLYKPVYKTCSLKIKLLLAWYSFRWCNFLKPKLNNIFFYFKINLVLPLQFEWRKIRTRITPNTDTFYVVIACNFNKNRTLTQVYFNSFSTDLEQLFFRRCLSDRSKWLKADILFNIMIKERCEISINI